MLRLSSSPNNICEVEAFVKDLVARHAVKEELYANILISLTEAVNNAIIHGNECDESRQIHLDVEADQESLKIRIYDVGAYSQKLFVERKNKSPLERILQKDSGGMGLKIIDTIMDDVHFYTRNNKHFCRLTKMLL